jgi:hypothetical protein
MTTTDDYRHTFTEFLTTQPAAAHLTPDQITNAHTREELGISSLNMIIIMMNYLNHHTNGTITIRPEWVPQLNDLDGITAILKEIHTTHPTPTQ